MGESTAEVVICGAGMAGVAAAWHLTTRAGIRDVVLVEEGAPLSLTSDKSTECYRNWWPGPGDAMVALANRSIDLMERLADASDNRFRMNRRGYLFATADPARVGDLEAAAREAESLGAGALRVHPAGGAGAYRPAPAHGFAGQPDGADLLLDRPTIRRTFPCLSPDTVAVLHARRCGWVSAQQLGMLLLEEARAAGARLVRGRMTAIDTTGGRVRGATVETEAGAVRLSTGTIVDAAGPFARQVAGLAGVDLPIHCEGHLKLSVPDGLGAVDRHAPLLLWADPVALPWSDDEREALAAEPEARFLLEPFPAGVHGRPDGEGNTVLLYWTYHTEPGEPVFPMREDPWLPEILVRGMSAMVPGLRGYLGRLPRGYVDGGYYARTRENRPLVGPTPVEGFHLSCAYSGFGIMMAMAGGELLAAHVTGGELPHYAPAFRLARYDDPDYRALLERWPSGDGQL
ncbi:MAG: FAD-binding oxidoreductase [Ectothiorhodospiraceae bacterium]|nr:FAD-binding oxidoreductase [Ectothiorhodospiraceae bacterium]